MKSRLLFRDEATNRTGDSLEALAAVTAQLDREGLAAQMLFDAPSPMDRTLYRRISAAPAPDVWGVEPIDPPHVAQGDASRALVAALERSIERAVGNARRVAVLAGGGIDSSGLLALTVEVMRRRGGTAFAVALDFDSPGDDRPHLRALEAHLGCEVVRVSPREGAAHLELLRRGVDGAPFVWPFGPVQVALYEAARRHGAEKLLTGAGGDHLFDGDPSSLARLARRDPVAAVRMARSLADFDRPRSPTFEWVVRPLLVPLVPIGVRRRMAARHRHRQVVDTWGGPLLRDMARRLWDRKLELALRPAEPRDTRAYFDHPQRRSFLWTVHQEERAGGIERQDPYFTHEVAGVMASMPVSTLFEGGRRRGLFRHAMAGRVPRSVLDRPDKADFGPAFASFLDAAGGARAFAKELEGTALTRLGIVAKGSFTRAATRALESSNEDSAYGYAWAAIATEAFLSSRPHLS